MTDEEKETFIEICSGLKHNKEAMLKAIEHWSIPDRIDILAGCSYLKPSHFTKLWDRFLFRDLKDKFIETYLKMFGTEGLATTTIFDIFIKDYYHTLEPLELSTFLRDLDKDCADWNETIYLMFSTNQVFIMGLTKREIFDEVWKFCLTNKVFDYHTWNTQTIYYTKQCND